jgi:hypothetical protein
LHRIGAKEEKGYFKQKEPAEFVPCEVKRTNQ